jgi:ferredoxin
MKAIVDPDTCTGCELCVSLCPEVFQMEGNVAIAYVDEVPPAFHESAREAAESCPVDAITIEE